MPRPPPALPQGVDFAPAAQANGRKTAADPMHSRFLVYYDAIVRHGSIRRAAEVLNVAPSAINRHLNEFEETLGTPLFERLPRGVRPTAAGELLSLHIRTTLRDYSKTLSEIEQLRTGARGHLTIACIETALNDVLPDAILDFGTRFPRIELTVRGMPLLDCIKAVGSGEADMCLIFNPPPKHALFQVAGADFPLGIIAPPDHPLAQRKSRATLSDLVGEQVLLPDETITIFEQIDHVMATSALRLAPRVRSNSMAFLRAFVLRGGGLSVMTPVGIADDIRAGRLAFLPLRDPGITPQRLIAGVADASMPVAVANFSQQLKAFLPEWLATVSAPERSRNETAGI